LKKQGVILLITLFFISALSVLILKNLDDSEQFINATALDNTLIQLKITSRNIEDQVRKLINKYSNNTDDVVKITQNGIPMNLKGIDMLIKLEYYNDIDCNINDINKSTNIIDICGEEVNNNINYQYDFKEILGTFHHIDNQKQLDYFLNKYIEVTHDDTIGNITNRFGYFNTDKGVHYLKCSYTIDMANTKAAGYFIFDTNSVNTTFKDKVLACY
jgi:hypothetical protein